MAAENGAVSLTLSLKVRMLDRITRNPAPNHPVFLRVW